MRLPTLSALTALATALLLSVPATATAGSAGPPGSWSEISTGTVDASASSSVLRTGDGVLHVVYPRTSGAAGDLAHTAVRADGRTASRSSVLASSWSVMDSSPALVAGPGGGLRVLFGGQQSLSPGFWSDGRMYTATAPASGATWTLPAEAVGLSELAYGSYGTAAATLADGTPVAAFPLNSDITWHTGTGPEPDQTFAVGACCAYDLAMVRSGEQVWLGWYGNGGTAATNGTFVRQIAPTLGPVLKAPGSSVGADSLPTGRVALVARPAGGVYAAYCSGYPTCDGVRLWRVGAASARAVPGSRDASTVALAVAPGGRLWVAWGDRSARVEAVRTDPGATRFGAVRAAGAPRGTTTVHALSLEGSTGRGDLVVNVGDGFWHTQVLAGLSLAASPARWRHGRARQVRFTVTDAGTAVAGSRVRVGSRSCTTTAQGTCRITFPRSVGAGRLTARASRAGYAGASRSLRVT